MSKAYVILSLKHMEGDKPTWWRANDAGYTDHLVAAGVYSEEQVHSKPDYYNNGFDTLAIPLTDAGFSAIGINTTVDLKKVKELAKNPMQQLWEVKS